MKLGVPRECRAGERRVAATPENVARLVKLGFEVLVETQAGALASIGDDDYTAAGARVIDDTRALWQEADIILKVQPPDHHPVLGVHEADLPREGATLISFLWPGKNKELIDRMAARKLTALAMDQVPRITRAQKMDALSSMANIAGYRAVIEAASFYGRFFTGQMTAAGRVPPAKVLVIGAGVAGLAAIGAARGLGAIVRAFDTRPTVKEQVKSMGAEFIELNVQEEGEGAGGYAQGDEPGVHRRRDGDVRGAGPRSGHHHHHRAHPEPAGARAHHRGHGEEHEEGLGDRGPGRGERRQLRAHRAGPGGGAARRAHSRLHGPAEPAGADCELPLREQSGSPPRRHGRQRQLPRRPPGRGGPRLARPAERRGHVAAAAPRAAAAAAGARGAPRDWSQRRRGTRARRAQGTGAGTAAALAVGALAFAGLGLVAPPSFLTHLTVFALACVVGWQVVWNVTPALHTPLMSVTNAISGIIVIGGMLQVSGSAERPGGAPGCRRDPARDDQHRRRVPGHAAHAEDVQPQIARDDADREVGRGVVCLNHW